MKKRTKDKTERKSIRQKLLSSMIVIAILAGVVGVSSAGLVVYYGIRANYMMNEYGFAQGDIADALVNVTDSRRCLRDVLLSENETNITRAQIDLDVIRKNYDESMNDVKKHIINKQEQQLMNEIEKKYEEYKNTVDDLIDQSKGKSYNEKSYQRYLMTSIVDPMYLELNSLFNKFGDMKITEGKNLQLRLKKLILIATILIVVAVIGAFALSMIFARRVSNKLSGSIEVCLKRLNLLAEGDLHSSVPEITTNDEFEDLAAAMKKSIGNLKEIIFDVTNYTEKLVMKDYTVQSGVEYVGDFIAIKESLDEFVLNQITEIRKLQDSAEYVAKNSQQISAGAMDISEGATEQSSAVEKLQATVWNVVNDVESNATQSQNASVLAKNIEAEIENSNQYVQTMVQAMDTIDSSTTQISTIIDTIQAIADETNLLALNASIEAARAGESGRGFAVVANSVGKLANDVASSVIESESLIENSIKEVNSGKEIAAKAAKKLEESVEKLHDVLHQIEEISNNSTSQSKQLEEVSTTIEQIASVVEENTAMSQESSAASQELTQQAETLMVMFEQYKLV